MAGPLAAIAARLRRSGVPPGQLLCFSGINIARDGSGRYGIHATEPLVGLGDHAFFRVGSDTFFVRDPRFERFRAPGRKRVFAGFLYWHLKYLKAEHGFGNYEIEAGTNERYRRKRDRYLAERAVVDIASVVAREPRLVRALPRFLHRGKLRLRADAWRALKAGTVTATDLALAIADVRANPAPPSAGA